MTQCRNLLTGGHLVAACTPLLTGNSLPYKVAHHIFFCSYHPLPLLTHVMMCRKIALLNSCGRGWSEPPLCGRGQAGASRVGDP